MQPTGRTGAGLRPGGQFLGLVLRGEAEAAAVFPNTTDVGSSRERLYAEFLRLHLPASCTVLFGGFLFDQQGNESRQVDIIVIDDSSLQFNLHNRDESGKAFACVDGCVAVVSLKSTLDSSALRDALENLASLPDKTPLEGRHNPLLQIKGYDDWPFRSIHAPKGVSVETCLATLTQYYDEHPEIAANKRPNLIHVGGSYCIARTGPSGGRRGMALKLRPTPIIQ